MSARKMAAKALQPERFAFSAENEARIQAIVGKYPQGRSQSAVMPLLDMAQRQHDNWLPEAALRVVAELLGMPYIRVLEVASFYTMYNLSPVGKHLVQVCTTTPCWLKGSDEIVAACKRALGVGFDETTPDGKFTLREVECLGACVNAPLLQIGDDYFEDLNAADVKRIIEAFRRGEVVKHGPQNGRQTSAPLGAPTSLTELGTEHGKEQR
jgi:NADH-quinone oxidoreductase E subunit